MEKESVKVLRECIELQLKKAQDYQNPNSNVKQAMHYRRGVDSIFDIMTGKMLRIQSLLESGTTPNNESLEDSFVDLINYASFAVSYMRGKMEGQDPTKDMFNKPKVNSPNKPQTPTWVPLVVESPTPTEHSSLPCGVDYSIRYKEHYSPSPIPLYNTSVFPDNLDESSPIVGSQTSVDLS